MPLDPAIADRMQLDYQLCFAVHAAAQAYDRLYRPLLTPFGLTYPQYLTLLVLWEGDDLTVKAIGQRLMLDSGTLTPLLKRLEQAGRLRRVRDLADERQVRVHLTDAGRALKDRAGGVPYGIACATEMALDDVVKLQQELLSLRDTLNSAVTADPDQDDPTSAPPILTPRSQRP